MNPLDLTGPEFLRFYLLYGVAVLAVAWVARSLVLRATTPPLSSRWAPGIYPRAEDAYAIALLRGGPMEAVRTLLGQLVSTGLARVEDGKLHAAGSAVDGNRPLQPIEVDAWRSLAPGSRVEVATAERRIHRAVEPRLTEISRQLASEGLLHTVERDAGFWPIQLLAWLLIAGAGLLKLQVAFSRGRTNVGFLILLLIAFTLAILILLRPPRRRPAGQEYLLWLREAHHGLIGRTEERRPGSGELALMAGIFGLSAVPLFVPLHTLIEPPRRPREPENRSQDSGGGSGCGSGSGVSSDSGGSSGGGGDSGGSGGGGGGCGGCGGGG